MPTLRVWILTD